MSGVLEEGTKMAQDLAGQVAAVTGAASGIGLECAKHMLNAGMTVFLVDRAEDVLKERCAQLGERAKPLVVDLLDPASVATMMPRILDEAGQLDVFHANAGSYIGGKVWEGDPDASARMLNLNINAAFRSLQRVLPHKIERKTGDIVMSSSVAGVIP